MHGKIVDLKTEDAQKLSVNQLNEIGELGESFVVRASRLLFRTSQVELLRRVEREGRVGERLLGAPGRPAVVAGVRALLGDSEEQGAPTPDGRRAH